MTFTAYAGKISPENIVIDIKYAMLDVHEDHDFSRMTRRNIAWGFIKEAGLYEDLQYMPEVFSINDIEDLVRIFHKYVRKALVSYNSIYKSYQHDKDDAKIILEDYRINKSKLRDDLIQSNNLSKEFHAFALNNFGHALYKHVLDLRKNLKKRTKEGRSDVDSEKIDKLVDWVLDIPNMNERRALRIFDQMLIDGIALPDPDIMEMVGKWASTDSDNVEVLRKNPAMKKKIAKYTKDNNLYITDEGEDVRKRPIFRALSLPKVAFRKMPDVFTGSTKFKIKRQLAESWTLDFGTALKFCRGGNDVGCVIMGRHLMNRGSLIWNFMNRYLGYDAFNSHFAEEKEVILTSQCDRCEFKEIDYVRIRYPSRSLSRKLITAIINTGYKIYLDVPSMKDIPDRLDKLNRPERDVLLSRFFAKEFKDIQLRFIHRSEMAKVYLW